MQETIAQTAHWLRTGRFIRTMHYHNTLRRDEVALRAQLGFIKAHYHTPSLAELDAYLNGTPFPGGKKGMVVGLFDGYRDHYDVILPLMREAGLHAWLLLVTDFLDTPPARQHDALQTYRMQWLEGEYGDGRYAMTWDEARQAAVGSTVVNHTATHYPLAADTLPAAVAYEIGHAQALLRRELGLSPDVFCWLGGAYYAKNEAVGAAVLREGPHWLLGERIERISGRAAAAAAPPVAAADGAQRSAARAALKVLEAVCAARTIYDGVPALLPLYDTAEDAPPAGYGEAELAERFTAIAQVLMEERGMPETEACALARDAIAVYDFTPIAAR